MKKGSVNSICMYPNSNYLISCSDDKTVKFWNYSTQEVVETFEQSSKVFSISVS